MFSLKVRFLVPQLEVWEEPFWVPQSTAELQD